MGYRGDLYVCVYVCRRGVRVRGGRGSVDYYYSLTLITSQPEMCTGATSSWNPQQEFQPYGPGTQGRIWLLTWESGNGKMRKIVPIEKKA